MYLDYWDKKQSNAIQYLSEIKELFAKANIADSRIPFAQPIGYGQISTGMASVFENMFVNDADIISKILIKFDESIGVFRKRILQNFKPVFWIETIIFLPKNIIKYLGFNSNSLFTKIFQLIYWFLSFVYPAPNRHFPPT